MEVVQINEKNSIQISYAILFFLSLFLLNETIRDAVGFPPYNVLFAAAGGIFLIYNHLKSKMNYIVLCLVFVIILSILLIGKYINNYASYYIATTIINLFIPLSILAVNIDKEESVAALRTFLKLFNPLIIILLALGIIDYLTKSSIQFLLANTIFSGTEMAELIYIENFSGVYRYYSFIGHPLTNAKYFLFFLILNNVLSKYGHPILNKYLVLVGALFGLLLSGSKTAIVIGVVFILLLNRPQKRRALYYTSIIIGMVILLNTTLFESNLKQRFLEGIENNDLSTGRNELITYLIASKTYPPLLFGGGPEYSRDVAKSFNTGINNFEYPIIMLSFDYGIILTVLIYLLLIFPLVRFIQSRDYYLFLSYGIIFLAVNTNNGIANLPSDALSQLCIFILLIKGLRNHKSHLQERDG